MKSVGGQAVIEGVMMRFGNRIAVAVRKGKKIIVKSRKSRALQKESHGAFLLSAAQWGFSRHWVSGLKHLTGLRILQQEKKGKSKAPGTFVTAIILATVFALVIFKLIPLGIAQFFFKTRA